VRVVAGSAKGVRLAPVPDGVRPVSERAREGLFSSLGPKVPGARVLDLFAGTGALGIEALSRGADHAVFVERTPAAAAALYENLERTRVADRATVVPKAVRPFLSGSRNDPPVPGDGSFDLVFLDPPYEMDSGELAETLEELAAGPLLGKGWTVALTRDKKSSTHVIPLHWAVARELRYGDSLLTLYVEVRWASPPCVRGRSTR
jgi:16S rRNA (guanine966-N2)-methyltransferase